RLGHQRTKWPAQRGSIPTASGFARSVPPRTQLLDPAPLECRFGQRIHYSLLDTTTAGLNQRCLDFCLKKHQGVVNRSPASGGTERRNRPPPSHPHVAKSPDRSAPFSERVGKEIR